MRFSRMLCTWSTSIWPFAAKKSLDNGGFNSNLRKESIVFVRDFVSVDGRQVTFLQYTMCLHNWFYRWLGHTIQTLKHTTTPNACCTFAKRSHETVNGLQKTLNALLETLNGLHEMLNSNTKRYLHETSCLLSTCFRQLLFSSFSVLMGFSSIYPLIVRINEKRQELIEILILIFI